MMKNYSYYIFALKNYAISLKIDVEFFSDLPEEIAGRAIYEERKVKLGKVPEAEEALLTLAHEIGHMISYFRYHLKQGKKQEDFTREKREDFAYLYGWYALKQVGANKLVTKKQWRDFSFFEKTL